MLEQSIKTYREAKGSGALIHCITNPISINQCANAVLAVGCRPIMAEHPKEVCEITKSAKALLLNLGNITDVRRKSMKRSAKTAGKNHIPVILDAVGVACSELRRKAACHIIKSCRPDVIKGNYSEINALYNHQYKGAGVDADAGLKPGFMEKAAKSLARKWNCVILASGAADIITDGKKSVLIKNGVEQLSHITGTGCMLGALTACFLPGGNAFAASVTACGILGIAGELAQTENKNGSFLVNVIDEISSFQEETFREKLKYTIAVDGKET